MAPQRSIAIVGAGLGGLVCARLLQLNNIPVVIYEREASPTARQQGGSLDMHSDSGFKALEMTQLVDEFKKIARYEDQHMKIVGMDGTVYYADPDLAPGELPAADRPEVDRTLLRQIFLDALKPDTIKWNHGISKVAVQDDKKATLHFLDSAFEPVAHEFVVGADGTWSRVRPILSSTVPEYSGLTFIDIFLHDVSKNYPDLSDFVKGLVMVLGDNKAIIPQRNGNDVVRVYAAFRKPLAWVDEIGLKPLVEEGKQAEARELLLNQFDGWCPEATGYLKVPCMSLDVRPLYTFKHHTWATNPHVTILGDAAHAMVPSGDGANLAMLDGVELATVIAKNMSANDDSWLRAIKGFEAKMQRRAWSATDDGTSMMDTFISDNDPAARAGKFMTRMMLAARAIDTIKKFTLGWMNWLW